MPGKNLAIFSKIALAGKGEFCYIIINTFHSPISFRKTAGGGKAAGILVLRDKQREITHEYLND